MTGVQTCALPICHEEPASYACLMPWYFWFPRAGMQVSCVQTATEAVLIALLKHCGTECCPGSVIQDLNWQTGKTKN